MNLGLNAVSTRCHSNESPHKKTPFLFCFVNMKRSNLEVLQLLHDNILEAIL